MNSIFLGARARGQVDKEEAHTNWAISSHIDKNTMTNPRAIDLKRVSIWQYYDGWKGRWARQAGQFQLGWPKMTYGGEVSRPDRHCSEKRKLSKASLQRRGQEIRYPVAWTPTPLQLETTFAISVEASHSQILIMIFSQLSVWSSYLGVVPEIDKNTSQSEVVDPRTTAN